MTSRIRKKCSRMSWDLALKKKTSWDLRLLFWDFKRSFWSFFLEFLNFLLNLRIICISSRRQYLPKFEDRELCREKRFWNSDIFIPDLGYSYLYNLWYTVRKYRRVFVRFLSRLSWTSNSNKNSLQKLE